MNKKEIASELARKLGKTKKEALDIVDSLLGADGVLMDAIRRKQRVVLQGSITVTPWLRRATLTGDVRTGRPQRVGPIPMLRVRISKDLREDILDAWDVSGTLARPSEVEDEDEDTEDEDIGPDGQPVKGDLPSDADLFGPDDDEDIADGGDEQAFDPLRAA